jgi:ABC-2 type transport system ATP-binding protein
VSEEPLVSARSLGRRFGADNALDGVDVDVLRGELLALVGPNGAGKSTLLAILAGGLAPTGGHVDRRDGVRLGWSPQHDSFYGRLSPRENLELFARLEREPDPRAAAVRLLAEFGLPDAGRRSGDLSAGNRQRLNLAIAMLGSPDVLLLDEPTAALDPRRRRLLWGRAARLREDGGAVVFATQNLDELERLADRVVALAAGRVVFAGSREDYERSDAAAALA